MYSMRLIHLLLVALGFMAAAQGTFLRNDGAPDAGLRIRQDEQSTPSDSAAPDPTTTTSDPTTPSSPSPSTEPGVGTTTTSNPPPTTQSTTSTPITTNDADPTSASGPPSDNSPSATSNNDDPTTTGDSETTTSRPSAFTTTLVMTTTDAEGRTTEITSKSEVTPDPTLNPAGDDNDNGAMPTQTRNIIIGVVCGVGGAIVLGALGFVAWRVWGRKKRAEENDGLMDYHTAGTSAFNSETKPDAMSNSTGPARSPFQTTLEDYHRPGQVNASSNF